jgi:hypothetical protein
MVMAEGQDTPAMPTPVQSTEQLPLRSHRGGVVLALGILGLVVCFICGIIAWVMGNNDLREMAAGRMDPAGRGLTKAGKICGMIGVIVNLAVLCICVLVVLALLGTAVSVQAS